MTDTLDAFLADVAQSAYGWPESLRHTYDTVRKLIADGIEGDLVECGVGNGVHPAMMGRACQDAGVARSIRIFDSFQGVPNGNEKDGEWNEAWGDGSGRLEPTGVAACSLTDVQANLERWGCDGNMFSFFQGWFQESLPKVGTAWRTRYEKGEAKGIAFLRLDGDLYESTLVCLRELYPLVVSGGVVVVDDWNLDGCRQAVEDYWSSGQFSLRATPNVTTITESGDVWWRKP
jgi:O-methyltransferase